MKPGTGTLHYIAADLGPPEKRLESRQARERELVRQLELMLEHHAAFLQWLVDHHRS